MIRFWLCPASLPDDISLAAPMPTNQPAHLLGFPHVWYFLPSRIMDTNTAPTVTQQDNKTRHSLVFYQILETKLDIISRLLDFGTQTHLTTAPFPRYFPRMKAPNFTPETASEMGKRGVIARKAKREREKQLLEAARLIQPPEGDEARKQRVQRQIDILLADMEKSKSVDVRLRISAALERLWKLVSPTAGVLRPKRGSGSTERPTVQPT